MGQALHSLADLALATEIKPSGHAIGVTAPDKQYEPTGQTTHSELPLLDWYVPATHKVCIPPLHDEPAGHVKQTPALAEEYVLSAHGVTEDAPIVQ